MKTISVDTEVTGLDMHHGARPFFVSIYEDNQDEPWYWEWEVNYQTREVEVPRQDIQQIQKYLNDADVIVGQNFKFDVRALQSVGIRWCEEHWAKLHDTLIAGHLLSSATPHDLTTMVLNTLGVTIQKYEDSLKKAVVEAKRIAKKLDWRVAKEDLPEMPSAAGSAVGFDYALPRAVAKHLNYEENHPWWTVLSEYANVDPVVTLALWKKQKVAIQDKMLWNIYIERMKLPRIISIMENTGITLNQTRLEQLREDYQMGADSAERICVNMSGGILEKLPKGSASNALKETLFNHLKLESNKRTPKGQPSVDKSVLDHWIATLPANSKNYRFVLNLKGHRSRSKALGDMVGYVKAWLPVEGMPGWWRLHPSLNITGTVTLRFSSNDPNEQNISKKEGFNLRYLFGPTPGREWWSLDYSNLELRIPAYEAGETEMIKLFEAPDEPPFFGGYHMLIFETLHPDKFAKYGMDCKKVFASTWYQWTKNGNFAVQYGAVEHSGTADRAYHVPGAQHRIKQRFGNISRLNDDMVAYAERHGYVETMKDKVVSPDRGYPLYCTRTQYGKILQTVPLSYHVQGTAMWVASRAMVKVQEYLESIGPEYKMIMQVHDEIVLDFPAATDWNGNLPRVRKVKKLMESIGQDIGVPLVVGMEYHKDNWSTGLTVK